MKSKMKKKMIAFLLCMVLVICNSVSILADTPAAETTTTEKQAKETRTTKNEGTSEEEKSSDNSKDTSKSSEETEETKEEAPETKTTEKKEETTGATTEKKEESTTATTTEKKEKTEESSETSDKKDTEGAEETATTGSEEETSEAAEETSESEEETTVSADLVYEDDDVKITVGANEKNAIPEGATLKVVPVLKDDDKTTEQYQEVEKKLEEKATDEEYDIAGFLAYDITFVDEDGNKVEPDGEVQVSMEYKESVVPVEIKDDTTDSNVTVMHLEENEEGQVKEVVDMSKNDQLKDVKTTAEKRVEKAEFVTDSFSVFTITWTKTVGNTSYELQSSIYAVEKTINSDTYSELQHDIGDIAISTLDTNPVLYIDNITSMTTDENYANLYSFEYSGKTYRFEGAYVATKNNNNNFTIVSDKSQKITRLTGRFGADGKGELVYLLDGETVSRELESGEQIIFMYSDDEPTLIAQCYSETGEQLTWESGGSNISTINLNNIGSIEIAEWNGLPKIDEYTYLYAIVGEDDNAAEVTHLRYQSESGILQYSADGTTWKDVNSQSIRFIYGKNKSDQNGGQPIRTADTKGLIDIDLFNYDNNTTYDGLSFSNGGSGKYTDGKDVTTGLVESDLGTDGYPKLVSGSVNTPNKTPYSLSGSSLDQLFNGKWSKTNSSNMGLNHLFTYNSQTGEYSYDSSQNYAYYNTNSVQNTGKNFIVYENKIDKGSGTVDGAFMPFLLPELDGKNLYADQMYAFGMHISFDFTQPSSGMINDQPMTFTFSGDDDVWVFVDGKLVMDMGGIHDKVSGTINFQSGKVTVDGSEQTTLSDVYGWTGDQVTFEANSTHRLEFFYMERGEGASNCSLKFNLPPKEQDTLEIGKEITDTDKQKYANVEFTFKAYLENQSLENEGQKVYEPIPAGTTYSVRKDGQISDTRQVAADNTFMLKPGETAIFNGIDPDLTYYVEELNVKSDEFDEVNIEGWTITYETDNGSIDQETGKPTEGTQYVARSSIKKVSESSVIVFENQCSEKNKRELWIEKAMEEGQSAGEDVFTFLVELENTDGQLEPYVGKYFLNNDSEEYTTSNGKISIKAGDTIKITDILSGTNFKVKELNIPSGYLDNPIIKEVQKLDGTDKFEIKDFVGSEGYSSSDGTDTTFCTGEIILDRNAHVKFTNSKNVKSLYVEKTWEEGNENVVKDTVIFGLFKKNDSDLTLVQVADISSDSNWKYTFTNLPVTDTYTIREVAQATGEDSNTYFLDGKYYYILDEEDCINEYYHASSDVTGQGTSSDNPLEIKNTLKTFGINVVKKDSDGNWLEGVEFELCLDRAGNNKVSFTKSGDEYVYSSGNVAGSTTTLVTNDTKDQTDGKDNPNLVITGLPADTYYLIETKTQSGFSLLANPVEIVLPCATSERSDSQAPYYEEKEESQKTYYYDSYTAVITNNKLFTMPEAGGRNIFMLTLAGTAMIALAAGSAIYYRRRRGVHNKTRR